ncbi:MAG: hypothetical protein EHM70_08880 [Chloroflexota bacterium]|nr:MAG: hypothetical protein EHM70_08880 [Chloroflexota bacterium]
MNYPAYYEIRVEGLLQSNWSEWFDGMSLCQDASGETLIAGLLKDQAALHGVLMKIRDLGLVLVSVNRIAKE